MLNHSGRVALCGLSCVGLTGCLGFGVGSLRSKERTTSHHSDTDGQGHTAPSGYTYVTYSTGMDSGNLFGANLGWKLGPSFVSIPGQSSFAVGQAIEIHFDLRLTRLMLSAGYADEGGSSKGAELRYGGYFGQLSYFHPVTVGEGPFDLYLHGGAAVQDGAVTFTQPGLRDLDEDAVGFRGSLGFSLVLKTGDLSSVAPDLMIRGETRYTRTSPVDTDPARPTGFAAVSMMGEVLILW